MAQSDFHEALHAALVRIELLESSLVQAKQAAAQAQQAAVQAQQTALQAQQAVLFLSFFMQSYMAHICSRVPLEQSSHFTVT